MIRVFLSPMVIHPPIIQRLGWTLLHFLWQGTAIAVGYAILRSLLKRSVSPQVRHALACAALAAMVAAPFLTFLLIANAPAEPAASSPFALWNVPFYAWQRLLPDLVAVWLAGVLAFSLRLFGAWRFTTRLRSTSHRASIDWQQRMERIAGRVGATRPVRLMISSLVDVPTVIGWLRPIILMPVQSLSGMPMEHITALLGHELAHIRRNDYLASILQSVVEAILFYHPAVWWISEQIRFERELCCDQLAAAACDDVLTYARALAELESRQPSRRAPALAANGGSLVNRIRRLIEPAAAIVNTLPGPGAAWAMTLLCFAGLGAVAVHAAQTSQSLPVQSVIGRPTVPEPPPLDVPLPKASPMVAFAIHGRRSLLYDPLFPAQLAQSPWQRWLDEDVVYIISPEERKAFLGLTTDEEREQFVEQFWLLRDPTPNTVLNEFKDEHYRRIAYANKRFASQVPGWKTDRGRIYIKFGTPDEIDSHPSGGLYERPAAQGGGTTYTYPFEEWRYRFIEGIGNNALFQFADPAMTGEYRMTTNASEIEVPADPAFAAQQRPAPEIEEPLPIPGTYTILPMRVQIDYMRVTESSTMANITAQFENRDLQFQLRDGVEKSKVNILGRIVTMSRRPVTMFEKPVEVQAPPEMLQQLTQARSTYQQSVPLAPGQYRLNLVAKDLFSGNIGNYQVTLDVPRFEDSKLAASSLIFADTMQRLPAKAPNSAFAIAGTKVRPRLGNSFSTDEKLGVYLQIYNFTPGENQTVSGTIEYEIDRTGSDEKLMSFSEETAAIPDASASQTTIEKMLPLKDLAPGSYTLKLNVIDRNGNQSLRRKGNFTVIAPLT